MSLRGRLLGEEGSRSPLVLGLVDAGAHLGVTPFNWRILRTVRHLRFSGGLPRVHRQDRAPDTVTDEAVALCERLITAYHAATGADDAANLTSGLWAWVYDARQRPLAEILERRDAPELAAELAGMFHRDYVLGMSPGSEGDRSRSSLAEYIWRLTTLDRLVSLGEALGVAAVQDAAQGGATHALRDGPHALASRIEDRLGFSIDYPDAGSAYGLAIGGRLVTMDAPEHIYSAVRLDQARRQFLAGERADAPRVVEIGGGYGELAYWWQRVCPGARSHTIVDLPIANVLQGYFLSRSLGADAVSLLGEPPARIALLPVTRRDRVVTPYDILVNKYGLPEMPADAVEGYLRWALETCSGIFVSHNLESSRALHGRPQPVVSQYAERVGGFEALRRDGSWLRSGCVEEIFAISAAAGAAAA